MFVNPLLPSQPPNHAHDPHHGSNHDPFQSLYDSLAKLALTNITNNPSTTTHPPLNPPTTQGQEQELHASLDHSHSRAPSHSTPISTATNTDTITITPLFPPGDNVIFAHSSFFRRPALPGNIYPDLPTPAQVREQARLLGIDTTLKNAAKLVPFPSHGLLVKYGAEAEGVVTGGGVSVAEGKAMALVRRTLEQAAGGDGGVLVPVPEVFGWRRDAGTGERFVYMDLPEGEVLEERWAGMSEVEREAVATQLRGWVREWRRLRLGGVGFVGSVDNGPLRDEVFRGCAMAGAPPPGPFPTAAAFHDYFVAMAVTVSQSRNAGAGDEQIRYIPQHLFPSEVPIVFTHGGFHPRNIIVSAGPNPRVVAIIGWEQAGWYPAYWELCKARAECSRRGRLGGWQSKYLPWILDAEGLNAELREWQAGALCQYWDYFVGLM